MEFLRVLCKIFFSVFLRVRVIDADKMPREGGVIVAANHESMLDMFMIGYRVPRYIKWMAKEELFKNKLVAKFITACGAYPVKRSTRDVSAARTTFEMLERGEPVGIFPQGTRAKGNGRTHRAKHGVAKFASRRNLGKNPSVRTRLRPLWRSHPSAGASGKRKIHEGGLSETVPADSRYDLYADGGSGNWRS